MKREKLQREVEKQIQFKRERNQRLSKLEAERDSLYAKYGGKGEHVKAVSGTIFHTDREMRDDDVNWNELDFSITRRQTYGKPKLPSLQGTDFTLWRIEVEAILKKWFIS
ncbi:hypothetical protein DPMN_073152 [Dreissena polymorpha]|uniref:Uncharacterized protein n=1 Tax=Dreissena polymorpha TaxID=45954 RepID=A0A9D4BYN6_DREPO|nr:hypothetical protein DPMN_073152 [Dreissena polymorpha]